MQAVSATPAHELLQRKDEVDGHSTRKTQRGAMGALSSYSFGPLETSNKTTGEAADRKAAGSIKGSLAQHNPLMSHSAAMVTTLQSVENAAATTSAKP
jgi:hypothetical protein